MNFYDVWDFVVLNKNVLIGLGCFFGFLLIVFRKRIFNKSVKPETVVDSSVETVVDSPEIAIDSSVEPVVESVDSVPFELINERAVNLLNDNRVRINSDLRRSYLLNKGELDMVLVAKGDVEVLMKELKVYHDELLRHEDNIKSILGG